MHSYSVYHITPEGKRNAEMEACDYHTTLAYFEEVILKQDGLPREFGVHDINGNFSALRSDLVTSGWTPTIRNTKPVPDRFKNNS